jgi:hypothetical protein
MPGPGGARTRPKRSPRALAAVPPMPDHERRWAAEAVDQVYGTQLSHETVSRITDAVLDEVRPMGTGRVSW